MFQPDMSNQYFYQTNQGQGQRDNKDRRDRKRSHDSNKTQRKPRKELTNKKPNFIVMAVAY